MNLQCYRTHRAVAVLTSYERKAVRFGDSGRLMRIALHFHGLKKNSTLALICLE